MLARPSSFVGPVVPPVFSSVLTALGSTVVSFDSSLHASRVGACGAAIGS